MKQRGKGNRDKRSEAGTSQTFKRKKNEIVCRPWLSDEFLRSMPVLVPINTWSLARKGECREARSRRLQQMAQNRADNRNRARGGPSDNDMIHCEFCHALLWVSETKRQNLCCQEGRVRLPEVQATPPQLEKLLSEPSFRNNIRLYNSMLSFTSTGAKVDYTVTGTPGPFVYRIHGQNHHNIGSLLPEEGKSPSFLQLYIYDTRNEIKNRMDRMGNSSKGHAISEDILVTLIQMLDANNKLARVFRYARDRYEEGTFKNFNITLLSDKSKGKQYDLPIVDEIAALVVGDVSKESDGRDIVLEYKSSKLKRISDIHAMYMSLQFPLLFPYGEMGYHEKIPYAPTGKKSIKREYVTMREFYAYQIQTRPSGGMTLIKGGRLLHQFIVDAYTTNEQARLRYIASNQKQLRADLYNNVFDAVDRGDTDATRAGKRIILPSSFTAGPRYMNEKYHDAMAICRWFGNPDLFITFTANPNWPEVIQHIRTYSTDDPNSRPDIEARVFKMKLDQLLADLTKGSYIPPHRAVVYTVEFQKRGLPHAHILIWLQDQFSGEDPSYVDKYISAELPDKDLDEEGFNLVGQHMMHGPCVADRLSSPCMENGQCSKRFPRKFVDHTTMAENGYVLYRRRDHPSRYVIKNDIKLDNRFVVPHNIGLLKKYRAHINVEWCCKTKAVKYLFKYITKGVDKATAVIEDPSNSRKRKNTETEEKQEYDEIKNYLECRYVSACEAVWRLFSFDIHYHRPAVITLPVHLENQHMIIYEQSESLDNVLSRQNVEKTMLTEWMAANRLYAEGRELTYVEFPRFYVWNTSDKIWTKRKQGFTIGRIVHIHPSAGELYYLRVLLNVVSGAQCYEDILTVDGEVFATFKDACYARGLMKDDKEWIDALEEASGWASPHQLRHLFVTFLIYCEVAKPADLWDNCWHHLAEGILERKRREFRFDGLELTDHELQQYALIDVEKILSDYDKTLSDFHGMPVPDKSILKYVSKEAMRGEFDINVLDEAAEHSRLFPSLNEAQRLVYDDVIESVHLKKGHLMFISGPGGTGKTYLYRTIISRLRSEKKIVIPVASAGIAALLMPGGRTAHSRFKIPLNPTEDSTCEIKPRTMLATSIIEADLIIWDEAPMTHRHAFEAVDRTLRDLMLENDENSLGKPFGGKTVLLGGDFRQILPVIPNGGRQDTVQSSISRSKLWDACRVYGLTKNMRLQPSDAAFASWILEVGNGTACNAKHGSKGVNTGEFDEIEIPDSLMLPHSGENLRVLSEAAYPNFSSSYLDHGYLTERAILTPRNETVEEINNFQLSMLPGEMKTYLSSDSIQKELLPSGDLSSLYTGEYLNSLEFPGLPTHKISLKVGAPVMLLRNMNQKKGLCNGTRLIIQRLGKRVLESEILTGTHVGDKFNIPRIILSPNDTKHPFTLRRTQFPIRVCYGMTVNKSQGQSLKQVALYLPRPVFTHGQLYVALSRVTSPQGLKILDDDRNKKRKDGVVNIVYKEIFCNIRTETGDAIV